MDQVTKLEAIEEIKIAKARYFRGVDTKDRDLLRSVYAEEVELDFRGCVTDPVTSHDFAPGSDEVSIVSGNAATEAVCTNLQGVQSVHHGSIPEIEITSPTSGTALWPMVDRLHFSEGAPFKELIGYGCYYDTYERVGDHWRITAMRLVRTRLDFISW